MNAILMHYKSLPRRTLQLELRKLTGDDAFHLWEFVGLGWIWNRVKTDKRTAAMLGLPEGTVFGCHVMVGEKLGSAFGDLMNVETDECPFDDPFK